MPALRAALSVVCCLVSPVPLLAQDPIAHPIPADARSGLPVVEPNDNRVAAGTLAGGVRTVHLEVRLAEWRPEHAGAPGLVVATLGEEGRAPTIPAPLLRVEQGTRLRVRVTNRLPDSTVAMLGLATRPAARDSAGVTLAPGEARWFEFDPGAAGTYLYAARLGRGIPEDDFEQEQLAGALVVDPPGGGPPDRVFVINIFGAPVDTAVSAYGYVEALTINGLSWPYTERLRPTVGDTLHWRVVNASLRGHPMHLHGFYFQVTGTGTQDQWDGLPPEAHRTVVTEHMPPWTTMDMTWSPTRPGNWLFHCHTVFHVVPEVRLPGATAGSHDHGAGGDHMAGLVLGLEVQPGATTDLTPGGTPRTLRLVALRDSARGRLGYALQQGPVEPGPGAISVPGPPLLLTRGEPTHVTVVNRLGEPTGVHWHGLELESWSDGVAGWSGTAGSVAPAIQPGDSFVARLTLQRAGTFIYHTHLNDLQQLTGGLYGAILVLEPGQALDPAHDHLWVVAWEGLGPGQRFVVNGDSTQPVLRLTAGEPQRLRFVNIGPANRWAIRLVRGDAPQRWTVLAKDGATLPQASQVEGEAMMLLSVGATQDVHWTPTRPGTYELRLGGVKRYLTQRIEVVQPRGRRASRIASQGANP